MPDNETTARLLQAASQRSIVQTIEDFCRARPNQVAYKSKYESFTWHELNLSANRIARALLARSENRARPMALIANQGAAIRAGLGVLKTGGFYVPLNPSHPRPRNRYIIDETEPALAVTDSAHLARTRELFGGDFPILDIDALDASLSNQNLDLAIAPDAIALVTYTSGSTGNPKGVVNTHQKLLHGVIHEAQLGLGLDDRFANVGSEGRNPFRALLNGAASYPWHVKEQGLEQLAQWLIDEQITVYRSGPRVFRQFVQSLNGDRRFPSLRAIILAGEPVHRDDVELYKRHFPAACRLVNALGSHEVGIFRSYVMNHETEIAGDIVPVGYAVPGKEVMVLDDRRQPLGYDAVGEIAVKCRYAARGYWRRPDLTEEKFIADPNGGDERIYLTGDLGRMVADGCLEHLGRKDLQLKVNGLRVDISEVEKALASHPGIKEVVVNPRADGAGDAQLVGYLVLQASVEPTVTSLRKFLQQQLPDYMIPRSFVRLDKLPLTASGTTKVDRRALPEPGSKRPNLDSPFVAPATPLEIALVAIWAEILAVEPVGIHDDFFDLGGHSLAGTRVLSQLLKQFQIELSLPTLFQAPTIAELALVITEHQSQQLGREELDQLLAEVHSLSDSQAQEQLASAKLAREGKP